MNFELTDKEAKKLLEGRATKKVLKDKRWLFPAILIMIAFSLLQAGIGMWVESGLVFRFAYLWLGIAALVTFYMVYLQGKAKKATLTEYNLK